MCAGGLTRKAGQDRIEFLAEVRNRALQPLWQGEEGAAVGGSQNRSSSGGAGFRADRIVFINDVYFCARDVVRIQPNPLTLNLFGLTSSCSGIIARDCM